MDEKENQKRGVNMDHQRDISPEVTERKLRDRQKFEEIKKDLRSHAAFRALPNFARRSAYQQAIKENGLQTISFLG